ncbi:MAG: hypothetical protein AB8H03_23780 [Saprospiraceae bacterium]
MKNLIYLFAISMIVFATACQKEEITSEIIPTNPYANVGERHNEILGNFNENSAEQMTSTMSSMAKENFIIQTIFEEENIDPAIFAEAKERLELSPNDLITDYDFTNYDQFFRTIGLEDDTRNLLSTFLGEYVDIVSPIGLDEVEKGIKDLEIKMMTDHQNSPDFEIAMTYLATLKSTNNYWNANQEEKLPGAKWWQVLLADAAGAAIGGLGGGAFAAPVAAVCSAAVSKT